MVPRFTRRSVKKQPQVVDTKTHYVMKGLMSHYCPICSQPVFISMLDRDEQIEIESKQEIVTSASHLQATKYYGKNGQVFSTIGTDGLIVNKEDLDSFSRDYAVETHMNALITKMQACVRSCLGAF